MKRLLFGKSWILLLAVSASPARSADPDEIKTDEFVLVQDRYATSKGEKIVISLEALIYEEGYEFVQKTLMHSLCEYIGISCDDLSREERKTFMKRSRLAVADHERDRILKLWVKELPGARDGQRFKTGKSNSGGWIRDRFSIKWAPQNWIDTLSWEITNLVGRKAQAHRSPVIDLELEGLSIISDVDDTIRESHVLKQKKLLRTIFFEPFKLVTPILKRITELRETFDGSFVPLHFVSAGPAPLYDGIREGLDVPGLRESEIYMRPFRFIDRSSFEFFKQDTFTYKVKQISEIFDRYPRRRFILIGDSGEKDPEVYREILNRYPLRVEKIIIRRIIGAKNDPSRFQGLPIEFVDETPMLAVCEKKVTL